MAHLPLALALALLLLATRAASSFTPLSDASLRALRPATDAAFDWQTGALLAPILIPRVPGTPGSLQVLRHFQDFFARSLPAWALATHNASATTPTSNGAAVPFVNFMATRDPPWLPAGGDAPRLLLVAHYDSKLTPRGFIGATDSAVPCAVLLHTAAAIDAALSKKWAAMRDAAPALKAAERGVRILLLDGEEAFKAWTDDDSLYGARALAEHWEATPLAASSSRGKKSELGNIELFVLLDLLGSAAPRIPSYFPTTHWAYSAFRGLEQRMREMGGSMWESAPSAKGWFYEPEAKKTAYNQWGVQDDHIPFLARGVEVLHLIPTPFPRVWHEMDDDGAHLDPATVKDWARLTAAWTAGFLGLEGWVEGADAEGREKAKMWKRSVKTEL